MPTRDLSSGLPPDDSNQRNGSASLEWVQSASGLIRDFLADFLGSFIGVLFLVAVCALVLSSGACIFDFLYRLGIIKSPIMHGEPIKEFMVIRPLDQMHAGFLFIAAYVVGAIFLRQDTTRPDAKSLERVLRGQKREERGNFEVQSDGTSNRKWDGAMGTFMAWLHDRISPPAHGAVGWYEAAQLARSPGARFPYSHLRDLLRFRQLNHLIRYVPWTGSSDSRSCSRMFINTLKVRIQLAAPRKYTEIIRSEAHIRMLSSIWYACGSVIRVFRLSLIPALPEIVYLWPRDLHRAAIDDCCGHHYALAYLAVASFTVISSIWLRRQVESRFHYLRVKEVVYVLETAYFVSKMGHPEILDDLPGS